MNDKLILVIMPNHELYCLNMYHDFLERLPLFHVNTRIYGSGYETKELPFIRSYSSSKDIHDIIKQDLDGQEPDIVFIMDANFGRSDFSGLKSRVYAFISDSVVTNGAYVNMIRGHNFQCRGVFHNYLYREDLLEGAFATNRKFYWPCWASSKYDYARYDTPKDIDFYMSGTMTSEYAYRQIFSGLFRELGLNSIDTFHIGTPRLSDPKADNEKYCGLLARSRYSPHDGGVNGRMQGRFYESSYMRSVIIAPDLGEEMRRNGFVHGINSVLFDRRMPIYQVKNMLRNMSQTYDWTSLSNNAYDLIKNHHTTDHRIKYFLDVVLNG